MSVASAKVTEPSMEDILASIRRIIADDQAQRPEDGAPPPLASAPEAPPPAAPPSSRPTENAVPSVPPPVLELMPEDEEVGPADDAAPPNGLALPAAPPAPPPEPPVFLRPAPPPAPSLAPPARANGHDHAPFAAPPLPPPARNEPPPQPAPPSPPREFERLIAPQVDAVVSSAFGSLASTVLTQNARTLEDLVQELLRPVLKAWLDEHLPEMVERLVKAEIERVARGGR